MKKIDMCLMKSQCADGMKKAESVIGSAIDTAKDITICPKFNVDFKIKSQKKNKDLFGVKMNCDKEISLFKLILGLVAAFAAVAFLCAALESMFSPKFDNTDCE